MILKDKKILVTGVVTRQSIAYHISRKIQEMGGEIILTGGPGRTCRLTERTAQTLSPEPPVIQMDVTDQAQIQDARKFVEGRWGKMDGLLHSVAYASQSCLSGDFADVPWEDVSNAFQISSYSLAGLASVFAPMMKGGSIVALDFDASKVWANYNWMGVCKAGLEAISRYLARDMGIRYKIRVNCIASGPLQTVAAKAIPAFRMFETLWNSRSVLPWDVANDGAEVANMATFLFSDLSRKVTGCTLHVDGGFHMMGSPLVDTLGGIERENEEEENLAE